MNKNKKAPATMAQPDVTAPAVNTGSGMMPNQSMAMDKSGKGFNCDGIAAVDPMYKTHNCGATRGGPGASGGDGGSAGAGSGSSGSSQ